jgi:PAS domain S-box-containing protein
MSTTNDLQHHIELIPDYLKKSNRFYVLATDMIGAYAYVNKHFSERFAFVTDDFIGKPITFATHEDDLIKCNEAVFELMKGEQECVQTVIRKPTNDQGGYFFSEWQFSFLKNEKGESIGVLCIGNDITEVERIKNEKEIAVEANKAKSAFVSNMSHEIRTPLSAVIGFTDLLGETPLNEEQKLYVSTLRDSSSLLLGIVNDILDFSKIEAEKMELSYEIENLKTLLSRIQRVLLLRAKEKDNTLLIEIDEAVPLILKMDTVRLEQILINLLGNALKFTVEGEVKVKVSLCSEDKQHAQLKFEISDTGIGISKDKLATIFEAFGQAENTTFKKYGGTGLGLSIANSLIKLMGGKGLVVTSQEGKGSCFAFEIQLEKGDVNQLISENDISFSDLTINEPLSIVVIDDNRVNLLLAKKLIHQICPKCSIETFETGKDALFYLGDTSPDLIFLDIFMPEMNGYEVFSEIKQLSHLDGIPVIALTASDSLEERERCKAHGIPYFLTKPIKINELAKHLLKKAE